MRRRCAGRLIRRWQGRGHEAVGREAQSRFCHRAREKKRSIRRIRPAVLNVTGRYADEGDLQGPARGHGAAPST